MRAFVAAAVLAAAATAETIVEVVASDPELSTLYEAIQAANLTETLEGDGPFTVFAPTNDAFDGVDLEAYLAAATGPDELRRLLLFHVVSGEERYEASFIETSTTLETAMGQDIRVNLNPIRLNPTAVDCSKSTECGDLVTRDVAADNGVIHKIDNVVFPRPAADADGPYTLFAPTNDAFGDVDVAYYLEAEHQDELVRLLEYHVIAAEVRSGDLSEGQEAENLDGYDLVVSLDPVRIAGAINSADVTAADILAINGVVHAVDAVLIPEPYPTAAPTAEPTTAKPTAKPTDTPTPAPSHPPSMSPPPSASKHPTTSQAPTYGPTRSDEPTYSPTSLPTSKPSTELVDHVNDTFTILELAGNTDDEILRLGLLLNARERLLNESASHRVADDLDVLIPTVERWADPTAFWAEGGERYSTNAVSGAAGFLSGNDVDKVWPAAFAESIDFAMYPEMLPPHSPLYPIWCMYRARYLIWAGVELQWLEELYYAEARDLLKIAHRAFPKNNLVKMYLGKPTPWPDLHKEDGDAPNWANAQRAILEKINHVANWWVDERQMGDGAFGGGFGDDVALWRWWTPVFLGFEDARSRGAWRKLAKGAFEDNPNMAGAPYPTTGDDVGEASALTADTLVPLLLLEAAEPFNVDDPECADSVSFHERNRPSRDCGFVGENLDRCENSKNDDGQIARDACYVTCDSCPYYQSAWVNRTVWLLNHTRDHWIGENDLGDRHFMGTHISAVDGSWGLSDDLANHSEYACGTPQHGAVLAPAALLWQWFSEAGGHSPEAFVSGGGGTSKKYHHVRKIVLAVLGPWLRAWAARAMAEGGGCKPAAAVPAAVSWPSGDVGGFPTNATGWTTPGCDWYCVNVSNAETGCSFEMCDAPPSTKHMYPHRQDDTATLFKWLLYRTFLAFEEDDDLPDEPDAGTPLDVGRRARGPLEAAVAVHAMLLGERGRLDEFQADDLREFVTGYADYVLFGEGSTGEADDDARHRDLPLEHLERLHRALSYNEAAYTSEVQYTDAAWSLAANYLDHFSHADNATAPDKAAVDLLYSMVTGDVSDGRVAPLPAVRWKTHPEHLAALVLRHNATFLSAQLYHFGAEPRAMGAQFLRLLPGNYSCVLSFPKREKPHANHTHFNVTAFGEFLEVPGSGLAEFHLAPRELVLLTVKRATREPRGTRAPTGLPSATPVPSASPAPSAVDDVGSRTPKPSRQPTRAPAPEPTDAYAYGGVLSPITEAMYVACGALDAAPSDAEVYDIVVDALDANCGDCCRITDCGEICAGLSCAAYAPATCAAVKFEYGCECDGCKCSSSYGYGNYTNSTSVVRIRRVLRRASPRRGDMDDKKRAAPFGRRQAGLGLVAAVTLFLLLCNFDADFLDGGASGMHAATADQMYEPTYPDDGAASFGVIYAANGPFVVRAFESALALGVGANATIFSDAPGARSCEKLKRRERKHVADRLGHLRLWAFTATPYDKTLYLDADAFPCASFDWLRSELSPALERYGVMATHSSMRRVSLHWLNAGVIAFNARRRPAKRIFAAWLRTYERQTVKVTDQRLFNEAGSRRAGHGAAARDWACCQIGPSGAAPRPPVQVPAISPHRRARGAAHADDRYADFAASAYLKRAVVGEAAGRRRG
ncbi:hypothetical protein JL720_4647 [Aureococcus anophagefferens]|nr:hypothetical protein JL720_4647 [Aureococcus anophagefferens]